MDPRRHGETGNDLVSSRLGDVNNPPAGTGVSDLGPAPTRLGSALLESAARGLSRYGYANLVLEEVAREAGYSRGALYHQFKDKEDLALAVIQWVNENWMREVGEPAAQQTDPVAGQDHPVGRVPLSG